VRENKPKKRKHLTGETEKTQKKRRKKKSAVDEESKDTADESPSKPAHVLFQKHDGKSPGASNEQENAKSEDVKVESNKEKIDESKSGSEDQLDAANVLLGLMGGSSASEPEHTA
jgi:hypothetical protein